MERLIERSIKNECGYDAKHGANFDRGYIVLSRYWLRCMVSQ